MIAAVSSLSPPHSSGEANILCRAKNFHASVCSFGFDTHANVGKHLILMYVECDSLLDAQQVFNKLHHQNEDTWTLLIQAYIDSGEFEHAFMLFLDMRRLDVKLNVHTYIALLRLCAKQRSIFRGQELHSDIVRQGLEQDLFIGSVLVDMYAKCSLLIEAQDVFNELPDRNVVSWTALMAGYVDQGLHEDVLHLLDQMHLEGVHPNPVTFAFSLKACSVRFFEKGQGIHASILKRGLDGHHIVRNSLIVMYAKHGLLQKAHNLLMQLPFRNVVMWTTLMVAYSDCGLEEKALECLEEMKLDDVSPDCVTFVCGFKACSSLGSVRRGRILHAEIVREGHELDLRIGNSIVDMYAKFGLLAEAREVFEELQVNNSAFYYPFSEHETKGNILTHLDAHPDVVSWTAMISGYAEEGELEEAVQLFASMQEQGLLPNYVTFVSVIRACGITSALNAGRVFHAWSLNFCRDQRERDPRGDIPLDPSHVILETALVDMYSKCGSMADAQQLFDAMFPRDHVAWNALLSGYACQGERAQVMNLVERMRSEGLKLDEAAILNILTVCSHSGLINTMWDYLEVIFTDYGSFPTIKQLNCAIDLLSRSGGLLEALFVVATMAVPLNLVTWSIILNACQNQADIEFV